MNKSSTSGKSLLFIIAILLLSNIVLVVLLISGGQHKSGHHDRKEAITAFLKNEIGFDQNQINRYDSLSKLHEEKTKDFFEDIKESKQLQFKLLGIEGFSDTAINNVVSRLTEKQKEMNLQMLEHVRDIRNLCTPAQQQKFDSLFYKILMHRGREEKKS